MTTLLISGTVVIAALGIGIVWLDRKLRDPVFYTRVEREVSRRK